MPKSIALEKVEAYQLGKEGLRVIGRDMMVLFRQTGSQDDEIFREAVYLGEIGGDSVPIRCRWGPVPEGRDPALEGMHIIRFTVPLGELEQHFAATSIIDCYAVHADEIYWNKARPLDGEKFCAYLIHSASRRIRQPQT